MVYCTLCTVYNVYIVTRKTDVNEYFVSNFKALKSHENV